MHLCVDVELYAVVWSKPWRLPASPAASCCQAVRSARNSAACPTVTHLTCTCGLLPSFVTFTYLAVMESEVRNKSCSCIISERCRLVLLNLPFKSLDLQIVRWDFFWVIIAMCLADTVSELCISPGIEPSFNWATVLSSDGSNSYLYQCCYWFFFA